MPGEIRAGADFFQGSLEEDCAVTDRHLANLLLEPS